jgi:hypothetical protein
MRSRSYGQSAILEQPINFFLGKKPLVPEELISVFVEKHLSGDEPDCILPAIRFVLFGPDVVEDDAYLFAVFFPSMAFMTGCIILHGMQLTEPSSTKVTLGFSCLPAATVSVRSSAF